jgi:predicted PurR-regulated permease PerM
MSKPWSDTTKRWVVLAVIVAGTVLLFRVRSLLPPVILAFLLAYLLNPLVEALMRLRLSRTKATVLTYLILLIVAVVGVSILVPMVVQQVSSINVDLLAIYESALEFMSDHQTITFREYTVELSDVFDRLEDSLIQLVTGFASRSAGELVDIAFGVAAGFASTLVWLIFILIVSFWVARDADLISRVLEGLMPIDYQDEFVNLRAKVGTIWDSFFRGLLLLSLTVGVITTVSMWLAGVKNALLLGMLAGVLEVVPTIGPIIACIPAVAVAFFQGSTHLPIPNGWFALLVLGLYVLIQQVENNFLAPRIIGSSVKIHPLVALVGAIAGYSVAGILGAFLAAPLIGSSRILGEYIYRKLVEVEPAPEKPEMADASGEGREPGAQSDVTAEHDGQSS